MSGRVKLGVVMLCHDQLQLAGRMARIWAEGGAAVAIHIDARARQPEVAQMHVQLSDLKEVVFTQRTVCDWGMFGLVEATLAATAGLFERFDHCSHVMLVSGSCLPLRPVADLVAYLSRHPNRDFVESVSAADVGWTVGGLNEERFTLHFPFSYRNHRKIFDRYVELQRKMGAHRKIPEGIVPHLGSQWWCLTRETLTAILEDRRRVEFDRYFSKVWIPDESYFQTLVRRHSKQIESRSLTLSKFDEQGKPYIFYDDHRRILEESGCFVARKIWPRAKGLLSYFPRPVVVWPSAAEPKPARLERLVNRAVTRRRLGRPGLYMQSCFPRKDAENGKTSAVYGVMHGFSDIYPDFENWLSHRVNADVHGHLLSPDAVEFQGRSEVGPGALSNCPRMRDLDPRGFLANLIRISSRMQIFQHGPRDQTGLDWFMATDPNARFFVVTGAWVVPLMNSIMPFDDIRRIAARIQAAELKQVAILQSVWLKARVQTWDLADFVARPAGALASVLGGLGASPSLIGDPPEPHSLEDIARFLQKLRNAGLRPQLTGDFALEPPRKGFRP